MAVLTEAMKRAIIQALACYDAPKQVIAMIKEEFGVTIAKQQVQSYHPERVNGSHLAQKWRDLFFETRAAFLAKTAEIPIAQQSYRLRVLQRALQKVEDQGNTALMAQLLEQAAKEMGGAFTNRRELTGAKGGPIAQQVVQVTPEELAAAVRSVQSEF